MHVTELLRQVQDLVTQIQEDLPQDTVQARQPLSCERAIQLDLLTPSEEQCLKGLRAYNINHDAQSNLFRFYQNHVYELRRAYQKRCSEAVDGLQRLGHSDKAFFEAFRISLQHSFSFHCEKMWGTVLKEVISYCHQGEARSAPLASSADATRLDARSSGDTKYNRGHDSDAVRILERAFQRTQNITQAEKYRLAEVTGLQPKQVTIWVSFFFSIDASRYFAPSQHTQPRPSGDEGHMTLKTIAMVIAHMLSRWHDFQHKAEPRKRRQQPRMRCASARARANHPENSLCSAFPLS